MAQKIKAHETQMTRLRREGIGGSPRAMIDLLLNETGGGDRHSDRNTV